MAKDQYADNFLYNYYIIVHRHVWNVNTILQLNYNDISDKELRKGSAYFQFVNRSTYVLILQLWVLQLYLIRLNSGIMIIIFRKQEELVCTRTHRITSKMCIVYFSFLLFKDENI